MNAHKYCSNHEDTLKNDCICGCFHCLRIFPASDIVRWIRHKKPAEKGDDGKINKWIFDENRTAFCPYCGVDSIIGESSGYPITRDFLEEMNHYWFQQCN